MQRITSKVAMALALVLLPGCEPPAAEEGLLGPAEPLRLETDETGGDGSTSYSDEELLTTYPATIIEKNTGTTLTANLADASGRTRFIGTKGSMKTEMSLYYDGFYQGQQIDDDSFDATWFDYLNEALGICSIYQLGDPPGCPHTMDTDLQGISLPRDCGHRIQARSQHRAENWWKGYLWGSPAEATSYGAGKSQPYCETDDDTRTGSTGGGGSDEEYDTGGDNYDPNAGVCTEYWCEWTYWYDPETYEILEVISVSCWCA